MRQFEWWLLFVFFIIQAARVLGDVNAVKRGRIGQRAANKSIASFVNRFYLREEK